MKINIKFRDTKSIYVIDTTKNNILVGMNGAGKTRFIESIMFLSKLKRNSVNISEFKVFYDKFNIEMLKINNNDFESLFKNKQKDSLNQKQYKQLYIKVLMRMYNISKNIEMLDIHFPEKTRLMKQINYLKSKTRDFIDNKKSEEIQYHFYIYLKHEISIMKRNIYRLNHLVNSRSFEKNNFDIFLDTNIFDIHSDINNFDTFSDIMENVKIDYKNIERAIVELEDKDNMINYAFEKTNKSSIDNFFDEIKMLNILYIDSSRSNIQDPYSIITNYVSDLEDKIIKSFWSKQDIEAINKHVEQLNYKINLLNNVLKGYCSINLKMLFDEKSLIFIKNGNNIDYNAFSSGEKQLITIFTAILFKDNINMLVIDEPEISFSLNYQGKFISDLNRIINSKKESEKIAVTISTHAPFILKEFRDVFQTEEVVLNG